VLALEAARTALLGGSEEAADSIKRIAGRIADVAREAGMQRAASAATVLQSANVGEVVGVVDTVLDFIRVEIASIPEERSTILIVEDDRLTSTVMRDVLASPEWRVLIAENGAEADHLLATEDISVVLLDLVLPDADGRDILVNLRKSPRTAWLPVIVLTAKDDSLTQSECYALGADGFLAKPVDWEVLKSAVSGKLQRAHQLHREARLDPLTLLPNRAAFWDAFERALAQRDGAPLSVCIIDLDYFKSINDTYGHATGDEALRIVARVLSNSLRGRDFFGRWGGEEFCVYLPHTGLRAAVRVLNNALQRVRQTVMTAADGQQFTLTFSAGVATVGSGVGGGDALAQADRLLYSAKTAGRNRICSSEDTEAQRPRVLLADDDAGASSAVKKILEKEGFAVASFPDGASALSAASEGDYTLAVVDVTMPIMDGFDLVRHLRALPKFAQVPIVMLTGAGTESDIVHGFDLGVSDYVVKPFNRGEFVARIWRLLRRR
jgi:two-component system cell cycle response regulator